MKTLGHHRAFDRTGFEALHLGNPPTSPSSHGSGWGGNEDSPTTVRLTMRVTTRGRGGSPRFDKVNSEFAHNSPSSNDTPSSHSSKSERSTQLLAIHPARRRRQRPGPDRRLFRPRDRELPPSGGAESPALSRGSRVRLGRVRWLRRGLGSCRRRSRVSRGVR